MPTLDLRFYLNLGSLIAVLAGFWALHHHGYNQGRAEIQAVMDAHLALDAQLIERAHREKIAIEQKQAKQAEDARIEYNGVVDELNAAFDELNRMRIPSPMLCRKEQPALPVATGSASGVPQTSANPTGTANSTQTRAGTFTLFEFYESALRDTAQCKALIELMKAN